MATVFSSIAKAASKSAAPQSSSQSSGIFDFTKDGSGGSAIKSSMAASATAAPTSSSSSGIFGKIADSVKNVVAATQTPIVYATDKNRAAIHAEPANAVQTAMNNAGATNIDKATPSNSGPDYGLYGQNSTQELLNAQPKSIAAVALPKKTPYQSALDSANYGVSQNIANINQLDPNQFKNESTIAAFGGLNDTQKQALDWQLSQNQKAVAHQHAAGGTYRSGAQLKNLSDSSMAIAANAYQQALDQFNNVQNANFDNMNNAKNQAFQNNMDYLAMLQGMQGDINKVDINYRQNSADNYQQLTDFLTRWAQS